MQRQVSTSIHPKTLYYKTDGTGRDLYIACDSGGHFKSNPKLGSRPKSAGFQLRPATLIVPSTASLFIGCSNLYCCNY